MHRPDFRWVVTPPVVALGEQGHGIYPAQAERFLKLILSEAFPDPRNLPGGVEIQMNLSES
jgi:hypothetical protein